MKKEALEVIYTRRSVRSFTGKPISRDDLMKILKAGMSAPSAVNIQPWAFVVVTKKREKLDVPHLNSSLNILGIFAIYI